VTNGTSPEIESKDQCVGCLWGWGSIKIGDNNVTYKINEYYTVDPRQLSPQENSAWPSLYR